jgi:hypothetical protein
VPDIVAESAGEGAFVSAGWVLVQTQQGTAPQVAGALAALPGVESAEATAGAYDVVARVADAGPAVPSARRVVRAALRVPGVTLAVCCHDNAGSDETRTIDLTKAGAAFSPR